MNREGVMRKAKDDRSYTPAELALRQLRFCISLHALRFTPHALTSCTPNGPGPRNAQPQSAVEYAMGCVRALLCIVLPPLAVIDKGCGAVLVTTLLTIIGWVPGIIAALIFCTQDQRR